MSENFFEIVWPNGLDPRTMNRIQEASGAAAEGEGEL